MERTERGHVAICKRMCGLLAEQIRTYSTYLVTATSANSKTQVGKYLDGFHNGASQGERKGLYFCGG